MGVFFLFFSFFPCIRSAKSRPLLPPSSSLTSPPTRTDGPQAALVSAAAWFTYRPAQHRVDMLLGGPIEHFEPAVLTWRLFVNASTLRFFHMSLVCLGSCGEPNVVLTQRVHPCPASTLGGAGRLRFRSGLRTTLITGLVHSSYRPSRTNCFNGARKDPRNGRIITTIPFSSVGRATDS